ncbi:hypothetical protein AGDE_14512 [Angomonas deanei]|uniref:RasGEF domain containing protein, putative n=1 Tax=Angomonas deanei TaxID=59799 RepID=A0A7G2C7K4_9TRYP|nr:hypothetical protein AGDE_14512 [Angomonas deanei]CAD2215435.1 RasGEF domain containing protein, putative [Angomonas deanei]|eukprot:EPY20715.1 hypothetical protein AGDE_14512 [Angomonas deanei]
MSSDSSGDKTMTPGSQSLESNSSSQSIYSPPQSDSGSDHSQTKGREHHRTLAPEGLPPLATKETYETDSSDDSGSSYSYSDLSNLSEASNPSSRRAGLPNLPMQTGGFSMENAEVVQENRSPLVRMVDVEVAVRKASLRTERAAEYFELALHQASSSSQGRGSAAVPNRKTMSADLQAIQEQLGGMYRRHMDAVIEDYLSQPMYKTALTCFQRHLPLAEQRMRTKGAMRVLNEVTSSTDQADGALPSVSGTAEYKISSVDIELMMNDSARRNRFLDDTLPWRPVDFNRTDIRLDRIRAEDTGGDTEVPSRPMVGGSVNLLIEILILSEEDPPFFSGIPEQSFTTAFMLLCGIFITPDALISKLIRFFRSVWRWLAKGGDQRRANYLQNRILLCLQAFCRYHECDITLFTLQRLAQFIKKSGFVSPFRGIDENDEEEWPCGIGVFAGNHGGHSDPGGKLLHKHSFSTATNASPPGSPHHKTGHSFGSPSTPVDSLPRLSIDVEQSMMSLSIRVQMMLKKHYKREEAPPTEGKGGKHTLVNTSVPRDRTFTLYVNEPKAMVHAGENEAPEVRNSRYTSLGVLPSYWPKRGTENDVGLAVMDVDAEQLTHQLCLLSYELFSRIRVREVLFSTWHQYEVDVNVSYHLEAMSQYSRQVTLWTAACIVLQTRWADSQRTFRHWLETCKLLYDLQNYEMSSAILIGLTHPAVENTMSEYEKTFKQEMLKSSEKKDLERQKQLMDPYASFSPSSLNSITARTSTEMKQPLIPILSPILNMLKKFQQNFFCLRQTTIYVRPSDGQRIVNWTKVLSIETTVRMWLRCQSEPYHFPLDPSLQEYLWSINDHTWTEASLMRLSQRSKK